MNTIKMAIIFTLISIPFYFIVYSMTSADMRTMQYANNFNNAINNAISDAKFTMNDSLKRSVNDECSKHLNIDERAVVDAFLDSFYLYFNAGDDVSKVLLRSNILALVILDYDGFYIYGASDKGGYIDHTLSEKYPYKYEEGDFAYIFSFGDDVKVVDMRDMTDKDERLGHLFADTLYEDELIIRSKAINDSVVAKLKNTLLMHRELADAIGSSFDYFLPLGENSSLKRQIDSVGLISIVQGEGYPKLATRTFTKGGVFEKTGIRRIDYMAGDIEEKDLIYAFELNGNKYYSKHKEDAGKDYLIFNSMKEAASEGYFPYFTK